MKTEIIEYIEKTFIDLDFISFNKIYRELHLNKYGSITSIIENEVRDYYPERKGQYV